MACDCVAKFGDRLLLQRENERVKSVTDYSTKELYACVFAFGMKMLHLRVFQCRYMLSLNRTGNYGVL